ncbi:hypothetical protein [Nonomuraea dietziae]|uniref:hypothetical protein n=1 Tax=Nonomuraea dietziae TaxID=65515 RepID=UPI0031DA0C89
MKRQLLRLYPEVGDYALYQTASLLVMAIGVYAFNRLPQAAARCRSAPRRSQERRDQPSGCGWPGTCTTCSASPCRPSRQAELGLRVLDDDRGRGRVRCWRRWARWPVRALADVRSITEEGATTQRCARDRLTTRVPMLLAGRRTSC